MNGKAFLLLFLIGVFALSLWQTFGQISRGQKRLADVKQEVRQTIENKEKLKTEIVEKSRPAYIEREARNRLNLILPGERIVILPLESQALRSDSGQAATIASTDSNNLGEKLKPEPNWRRWWKLFFE